MTNSVNGFRKAGLFPCNRHIFTDEEFSIFNDGDEEQDLLNVQRNDENADLEDTSCVLTSIENQSEPTEILPNSGITNDNPSDEYQGLASSKTASTASVYDNPVPSTSSSVSPFALKPVPRLPKNNSSSKKTRTGAASIITASPYKKSLEESLNKNKKKKIRKDRRNNQLKTADKEKNPIKRKKLKKLVPVPKTMTCLSWQIAVGMNMMLNVPTVAVTFRRIQEEKNGPNVIVVLNGLMKIVEM
ncbi:hypothetical protein HHI36_003522 [Cryptolaemus montrouzieri]|uniref:Uncharacterized protein n=1 Tax=Cryptolaemus montrouzieri TaxID=559131 RepID=A0ABD2PDT6_9CUCU